MRILVTDAVTASCLRFLTIAATHCSGSVTVAPADPAESRLEASLFDHKERIRALEELHAMGVPPP